MTTDYLITLLEKWLLIQILKLALAFLFLNPALFLFLAQGIAFHNFRGNKVCV